MPLSLVLKGFKSCPYERYTASVVVLFLNYAQLDASELGLF